MRRTRLYVFLSVFSLVVAGSLAVAQKRCGYLKDHSKLTSLFHTNCKSDCKKDKRSAEEKQLAACKDAWKAMHKRDFEAMRKHAGKLKGDYAVEGLRLQAYAQRGLGRYDEAAKLYTKCIEPQKGFEPELVEMIDAHIGRAHCRFMLHDVVGAHSDIERAIGLAKAQAGKRGTVDAHYQLACAFAVQSSMLTGERAEVARRNAVDRFELAVTLGFEGWDHARADLDMDALRADSQFSSLVGAK